MRVKLVHQGIAPGVQEPELLNLGLVRLEASGDVSCDSFGAVGSVADGLQVFVHFAFSFVV